MTARQCSLSSSLLALALLLIVGAAPLAAAPTDRQASHTGDYIVVYRDGFTASSAVRRAIGRAGSFTVLRQFVLLNGFTARLSAAQVAALRADPQVALVDEDRPIQAAESNPVASGETVPTGARRIEAATSQYARGAAGVRVAVIDTGIDLSHPDLDAVHGVNCMGSGQANDNNGHGSHVAGTIGARNDGAGVIGVAPGTRLVAVKVLDASGSGTNSSLICGIDWVTSTLTDADPTNDIRVANMSLGGIGDSVGSCSTTGDALHRAVCASVAAGVTYVVAAGNSSWGFDYGPNPDVPAAYPQVLTVTAMTDSDGLPGGQGGAPTCRPGEADEQTAWFSNFAATAAGQAHTIAGPGTCIRSTWMKGGYATISGTSMATPHVAAAVALCINEAGTPGPCAGMTPAQIIAKMRSDAQAGTMATSEYGFSGDPVRPMCGRYYGYLVRMAGNGATALATEPPRTCALSPAAGATDVGHMAPVRLTFTEPMNKSATQAAFSLVQAADGKPVSGSFTWSGNAMTFRPAAPLRLGTTYRATLGAGARSSSGAALPGVVEWTFATATSIAPSSAVIVKGKRRSGGFARLAAHDDSYFEVNSTAKATYTTAWYGSFPSVPRDVSTLTVTYSGRNSRACTQTVALWRWGTRKWVVLDSRSVGTAKVLVERPASGTLSRFISGSQATGDVRVRVRCTTTVGKFYARADYMRLAFTQP